MGQYAKRLHKKLASKSSGLPTKEPKRRPGDPLPGGGTDMETLIKEGYDPIHAVYIFMQHHQQDAVFLAGIPDVKTSLPHA